MSRKRQPFALHQELLPGQPVPAYRVKGIVGQSTGAFRPADEPGRLKPGFAWMPNAGKMELFPRRTATKIKIAATTVYQQAIRRRKTRCQRQARKYNRRKPAGHINVARLRGQRTR